MLSVLEEVDRGSLKYTRTGNRLQPDFEEYERGEDIPGIGTASDDSSMSCETFLIARRAAVVHVRRIDAEGGVNRYCVDQLINPDSVALTPSGVWTDGTLLSGRVATCSASLISQDLMKAFRVAIRKRFTSLKPYWLGPQALVRLKAGARLTDDVRSPRTFDFQVVP